jgi:general stress protein 26
MMTEATDRQEAVEKLGALIRDMPVAMLTTCLPDGSLHSRPMVNVNHHFDGELWFFTHDDDPKAKEIEANRQVNVSFAEPGKGRYVSLAGSAELVRDQTHAEVLWNSTCQQWFPEGWEDPKLALLKITLQHAQYWDEKTHAMQSLHCVFTGGRTKPEKHAQLDLTE